LKIKNLEKYNSPNFPISSISILNIFSLYKLKKKSNKVRGFYKKNRGFSKFIENKIFWRLVFEILIIQNLHYEHVRSHTKFGPIGSAVLTFIGYKHANKQLPGHANYISYEVVINKFH